MEVGEEKEINMEMKEWKEKIWGWLGEVMDPEVPVLTILDLGIVRELELTESQDKVSAKIWITPTYSGCPAMDMIAANIRMGLSGRGLDKVEIAYRLSPAWTTDWMSEEGKEKLKVYGIAPPRKESRDARGLFSEETVACPRCGSDHTEEISQFGATACKALHRCLQCLEPFEYFKCH